MADYEESIYHRATQRFVEIINTLTGNHARRRQKLEPNQFNEQLKSVVVEVFKETKDNRLTEEKLEKVLQNNPDIAIWGKSYHSVKSAYAIVKGDHDKLIDEKKQISQIETSTHRRNLLFRGLTTLVVGLVIMAIYAIAQCLGINMPLMRVPL